MRTQRSRRRNGAKARSFRAVTITVLTVATTAACSSAATGGSTAGGASGGQSNPASSGSGGTNGGNKYQGDLTYWFWGKSDIPGIDKWMQQRAAQYEKMHPKVHISTVEQSNSTIISSFRLAAQSKSGPDIDTQWATLPTLTPYFDGDVTPISDFVPKSETRHWFNTSENTVDNKLVAMPLYLIGIPLVWNKQLFKDAGLNPNRPPKTWEEFLHDAKVLKQHNITPLGMGNKDGFFGAWMVAIFGKQMLNSTKDITQAIAQKGNFANSKFGKTLNAVYGMIQNLVSNGYVNSDIASLTLTQGAQLFPQKKAAMAFTTDGNVISWAKAIGDQNIGVARPPIWSTAGALSNTYDVTQSSDEFITSWSHNKEAAATFLRWLHTPANLSSLFKDTGAFPADDRFDASAITDPIAKKLYKLDTTGKSVWPENYYPPTVDSDADIPAGQLITSKSGTPAQAVDLWARIVAQWQTQQPSAYSQFVKWANGG